MLYNKSDEGNSLFMQDLLQSTNDSNLQLMNKDANLVVLHLLIFP